MLKIKEEVFKEQFAALVALVKDDPQECRTGLALHPDSTTPEDADPTIWLRRGPYCEWIVWLKFDMPVGEMRFEARIPIGVLSNGAEESIKTMRTLCFIQG